MRMSHSEYHPILTLEGGELCAWDAVITCTPVTIFFSTWGAVMLEKNKQTKKTPTKIGELVHVTL